MKAFGAEARVKRFSEATTSCTRTNAKIRRLWRCRPRWVHRRSGGDRGALVKRRQIGTTHGDEFSSFLTAAFAMCGPIEAEPRQHRPTAAIAAAQHFRAPRYPQRGPWGADAPVLAPLKSSVGSGTLRLHMTTSRAGSFCVVSFSVRGPDCGDCRPERRQQTTLVNLIPGSMT